jgi:8-hydroxy-5-deazaflavin:NADPH oxidoreductase
MKVTIIGAGNMGRAIGTRLLSGGHDVQLIDRDPGEADALAEELGGSARGGGPDDAIEGDVVVLAMYYPGEKDAAAQYADRLRDKIVVEISNPVDTDTWDRLATPAGTSAAEEIASVLEGARVVKAFNTTFANTLVEGEVGGQQLDVLIAGDDDDAKRQVKELAESGGVRVIDAGPLARAQQLEQLGFLHISLQEPLGTGYRSSFKLHA